LGAQLLTIGNTGIPHGTTGITLGNTPGRGETYEVLMLVTTGIPLETPLGKGMKCNFDCNSELKRHPPKCHQFADIT
jgi:hypothetical protein